WVTSRPARSSIPPLLANAFCKSTNSSAVRSGVIEIGSGRAGSTMSTGTNNLTRLGWRQQAISTKCRGGRNVRNDHASENQGGPAGRLPAVRSGAGQPQRRQRMGLQRVRGRRQGPEPDRRDHSLQGQGQL